LRPDTEQSLRLTRDEFPGASRIIVIAAKYPERTHFCKVMTHQSPGNASSGRSAESSGSSLNTYMKRMAFIERHAEEDASRPSLEAATLFKRT
jgi:hypothetical protein